MSDDDNLIKIDVDRTTTPEPTTNKDDASAHILSPKKKRSLDQLQENGVSAQSEQKASVQENEKERETKRHRDASQDRQAAVKDDAAPVKVTKCFENSIIRYWLTLLFIAIFTKEFPKHLCRFPLCIVRLQVI